MSWKSIKRTVLKAKSPNGKTCSITVEFDPLTQKTVILDKEVIT